jgi:hypothetical protein
VRRAATLRNQIGCRAAELREPDERRVGEQGPEPSST